MKKLYYILKIFGTVNRQSKKNYENNKPSIDRYFDFLADWVNNKIDWLLGKKLPFTLKELKRHCYIIAKSGSGKSELIKYFFYELQKTSTAKQQRALILLEPHGDLAKEIKTFSFNADSDRIVYIDPYLDGGKHTPTINPLQTADKSEQNIDILSQELVRTIQEMMDNSQITLNMGAILKPCIATLLRTKNPTLLDLQRFMDDDNNGDLVELGKQSPLQPHRDFFTNGFYKSLYAPTKQSIYIKIQSLLNSHTLYNLLIGESTIDLQKEIDEGKIIIFNCSKGEMGSDASDAFGKFMVAILQSIVFKRTSPNKHERKPTFLFIDEFQNYVSDSIGKILAECRKYGLYLTLAHQFSSQIDPEMRDNVLSNTGVKIAGENNEKAHRIMSKELDVTLEELKHLPKYYFFVRNGKHEAKRYKAPSKLSKGKRHYLNKEQIQEQNRQQIERYYKPVTKATAQQQIQPTPQDHERDDYTPDAKFREI